jgi:hypothetical protein
MLKDVRYLACLGLAATSLAGVMVPVVITAVAADEQFKLTAVVPIALPGGATKSLDAFDISWFDKASHTLAVAASRVFNTASLTSVGEIIIVDTEKNIVTKEIQDPAHPFAGACSFPGRNTVTGPNGVIVVEKGKNADVWAGDGPVLTAQGKLDICKNPPPVTPPTPADIAAPSSVKVFDLNTGAFKKSISTGGTGRADELCYNPRSDVVLIANDETFDNFITFIDEDSFEVLDQMRFDGKDPRAVFPNGPRAGQPIIANGIEQCQFNPKDGKFYINIPATGVTGSGAGATLVISPRLPFEIERVIDFSETQFASTPCAAGTAGPAGLAFGSDGEHAVSCGVIVTDNGKLVASFPTFPTPAGTTVPSGADEIYFNDGHYFFADTTPAVLGVLDAGTKRALPSADVTAPTATGSHSVAAGENHVYVPLRGFLNVPAPLPPTPPLTSVCNLAKDVHGNIGSNNFGCIGVYTAAGK